MELMANKYETEHYRVYVGAMTGPEDLPVEMRVKYIVQHKRDGVVYGVSGSLGSAIIAALGAEKELEDASELMAAGALRNGQSN
jgi:hypothetical protein